MSNILIESFTNFANSLKETYTKKADIVDNLDSTDTDKPLSANMGSSIKAEIDGLKGNTFTGVLSTGSTSVTIATSITDISDRTMDIYTSKYGLNPTAVETDTSGNVTLTFDTQSEDINIKLIIK